jgi:hypothetical protein
VIDDEHAIGVGGGRGLRRPCGVDVARAAVVEIEIDRPAGDAVLAVVSNAVGVEVLVDHAGQNCASRAREDIGDQRSEEPAGLQRLDRRTCPLSAAAV